MKKKVSREDIDNIINYIKNQRWFAEKNEKIVDLEIYDSFLVNDDIFITFIFVIYENRPKKLYFLPFKQEELDKSKTYDIALDSVNQSLTAIDYLDTYNIFLNYLIKKKSIITQNNNVVYFEDNYNKIENMNLKYLKSFKKDISSNCVNINMLGDIKVINKIYKSLSSDDYITLLKKISKNQKIIPTLFGSYYLEDKKTNSVYLIGFFQEFFEGDYFDVFLNKNIRSLWEKISQNDDNEQIINNHSKDVFSLLQYVGSSLCNFHIEINNALRDNSNKVFNTKGFIGTLKKLVDKLSSDILKDNDFSKDFYKNASQKLYKILENIEKTDYKDFIAAFSHGDLHIDHILYKEQEESKKFDIKIIDFHQKCTSSDNPDFVFQHPLQDIAAINRSLEYFSFDEANRQISNDLNITEEQAALLQLDLLIDEDNLKKDVKVYNIVKTSNYISQRWQKTIVNTILYSYKKELSESTQNNLIVPDEMDSIFGLFYFMRLVKELEYNYLYDRKHFKVFDFFYLMMYI